MLADKIIQQRECGLISPREARAALRRVAKQCKFNADYSDTPDPTRRIRHAGSDTPESYARWQREARAAHAAAQS